MFNKEARPNTTIGSIMEVFLELKAMVCAPRPPGDTYRDPAAMKNACHLRAQIPAELFEEATAEGMEVENVADETNGADVTGPEQLQQQQTAEKVPRATAQKDEGADSEDDASAAPEGQRAAPVVPVAPATPVTPEGHRSSRQAQVGCLAPACRFTTAHTLAGKPGA